MLLRGPQTPGELRTRAARMADVADVTQVEAALEHLAQLEAGACVVRLAREPGKREARYAHLFSGDPPPAALAREAAPEVRSAGAAAEAAHTTAARLEALEQEMRALRAELDQLRQALQAVRP